MTCDKCVYCFVKSNQIKSAKMHTMHHRCFLLLKEVNPDDTCDWWKERKEKMRIIYDDGEEGEVEE